MDKINFQFIIKKSTLILLVIIASPVIAGIFGLALPGITAMLLYLWAADNPDGIVAFLLACSVTVITLFIFVYLTGG